jgi:hypothetical protein
MRLRGVLWTRATVAQVETSGRTVSLVEGIVIASALDVPLVDLVASESSHVAVDAGTWSSEFLVGVIKGETDDLVGDTYWSEELSGALRMVSQSSRVVTHVQKQQRDLLRDRWGLESKTRGEEKALRKRVGDIERDVAKRLESRTRLGVTGVEVVVASDATWNRSFLEERDRRVAGRLGESGSRTQQALRGRATREMELELQRAIESAADRAANEEDNENG